MGNGVGLITKFKLLVVVFCLVVAGVNGYADYQYVLTDTSNGDVTTYFSPTLVLSSDILPVTSTTDPAITGLQFTSNVSLPEGGPGGPSMISADELDAWVGPYSNYSYYFAQGSFNSVGTYVANDYGNQGELTISEVPEPGQSYLVGFGLLILLWLRISTRRPLVSHTEPQA